MRRPKTDQVMSLSSYFLSEYQMDAVLSEHSYSKSWSCHPEASRARPKRTLFAERRRKRLAPSNDDESEKDGSEGEIDVVEAIDEPPTGATSRRPAFDEHKMRSLMYECETYSDVVRPNVVAADKWEEQIKKDDWTPRQHALFRKAVDVLEGDQLARLAYENHIDEAIMRRLHTNKSAVKFRKILADISWDMPLCQWLHGTFSNGLSTPLLATYLDILQAIRTKAPSLVDRMVSSVASNPTAGLALSLLLKRPWDPAIALLAGGRQRKLPGSPFVVVVPSVPPSLTLSSTKRSKAWHSHLSTLGKVIPVTIFGDLYHAGANIRIDECVEKLVGATQRKVRELQGHFNSRPVVLIGWDTGALIACKVASKEDVNAVICLGYPFEGISLATKETCWNSLMMVTSPVQFILGSESKCCNISRLDYFRDKMQADTSMTVVEGADDYLRMSWERKKSEAVTQSMIDKCLQEEISEFLCQTLTSAPYRDAIDVESSDDQRRLSRRRRGRPSSNSTKYGSKTTATPWVQPKTSSTESAKKSKLDPTAARVGTSSSMVAPLKQILGASATKATATATTTASSPSPSSSSSSSSSRPATVTAPISAKQPLSTGGVQQSSPPSSLPSSQQQQQTKPAATLFRYTPSSGQSSSASTFPLTKQHLDFSPQVFVRPLGSAAAATAKPRVGNEHAYHFHKVNPDAMQGNRDAKVKKTDQEKGEKKMESQDTVERESEEK